MAKKTTKTIRTETFSCKYGTVRISLSETVWKNGKKRLTAKVVEAEQNSLIGENRSPTVDKADDLTQKRVQVCNRVLEVVNALYDEAHPTPSLEDLFYSRGKNTKDLTLWYDLCPPSWKAPRTKDQALRYFIRHALQPVSNAVKTGVYGTDVAQRIANDILSDVLRNQTIPYADDSDASASSLYIYDQTARLAAAKTQANINIRNSNSLFAALRDSADNPNIYPVIALPSFDDALRIPIEQCKALPPDVLTTLAQACFQTSALNPLSLGTLIMMCGLVRTAEAVCPKYGEILLQDGYAIYGVIWQANGCLRIAQLKTDSSYRLVVLPYFVVVCLERRRAHLRLNGYSDEEINQMYVVSDPDDPYLPAKPGKLSAHIRKVISLIGRFDSEYWTSTQQLMMQEPDPVPEYARSQDLMAYILRRTGCTYLCNCAGLDPRLVDVMMGHQLRRSDTHMVDMLKDENLWSVIADHMECLVFDPQYTRNPAFFPRTYPTKTDSVPHRRVKIHISNEMIRCGKIVFSVESLLPEDLTVTVPNHATIHLNASTALAHDSIKYPIICEQLDLSFHKTCRETAKKIIDNNREVFQYG